MQRMIQVRVIPVTGSRSCWNGSAIGPGISGAYGTGVDHAYTMVHNSPQRTQQRCTRR